MPARVSAGLVMYRFQGKQVEVFLVHPGGPFFAHKDDGHWSIPKGLLQAGETMLQAALREVREEVGIDLSPELPFLELGSIRQKGGKVVHAWAVEAAAIEPKWELAETFAMEWPPGSGKVERFLEVDQGRFFSLPEAVTKVKEAQVPLLDRLARQLGVR